MRSSRRLQPVADIAKHSERHAARRHGDSLREHQEQQRQLDELIKYRDQYMDRFKQAGASGLSIVQMRDYQLFITRLDQAIAQQQQLVSTGEQQCQQSQANWIDKRGKSEMINKVVENRALTEQQRLDRREQKELDDSPAPVSPER